MYEITQDIEFFKEYVYSLMISGVRVQSQLTHFKIFDSVDARNSPACNRKSCWRYER
jgi:hypothetical protein